MDQHQFTPLSASQPAEQGMRPPGFGWRDPGFVQDIQQQLLLLLKIKLLVMGYHKIQGHTQSPRLLRKEVHQ